MNRFLKNILKEFLKKKTYDFVRKALALAYKELSHATFYWFWTAFRYVFEVSSSFILNFDVQQDMAVGLTLFCLFHSATR